MSAAHHDDGHEAFDPEPIADIGADETPSPAWLPIVGAVLFTVGVGWVFYPGADAIAKAPEPTPSAAARAAAAEKPAGNKPALRKPAGDSGKDGKKAPRGLTKGAVKKVPQKQP